MATAADQRSDFGDVTAGACLVLAAFIAVLAMAHHPTSVHGGGGIGDFVHGTMIVVLSALFYGFAHFALRRGLEHPLMLAGLVAYGLSFVAHLGAASINGFVVPALAARGPDAVSHDIFILCWEVGRSFARTGVFATGVAFVLWSVDFLWRSGTANRVIGAAGVLAGIVPAVALASGTLSLDVSGAFAIYAVHAVWAVLVGGQLIRRRV